MISLRAGDQDVIAALSTAPGIGAIAVLRISGAKSWSLIRKLAPFLPAQPESHRAYFGRLVDPSNSAEVLDEVLLTTFAQGRSFTGEESAEISTHGGVDLPERVLQAILAQGARLAHPGEFTYRAFVNGRMDLVQAEAVLEAIESRSREASKMAMRHLKGELSSRYLEVEDGLLWMGAHIEASIDFSSEGIELKPSAELRDRGLQLSASLQRLINSYHQGRVVAHGLRVALVGAPNAGKSSLLNALVGEERAIVTPEAGTTRDLIEVESRWKGLDLKWMDTAGLRESESVAEKLGIEKTLKARSEADIVLIVIDLSSPDWRTLLGDFVRGGRPEEVYVFNKVDLDQSGEWTAASEAEAESLGVLERSFWISASSRMGLENLLVGIECAFKRGLKGGSGDDVLVTQARHVESLERIHEALQKALVLIEKESSPELVAFELKVGVQEIHRLLGKEFHEQVIDRVFKEFCLGK